MSAAEQIQGFDRTIYLDSCVSGKRFRDAGYSAEWALDYVHIDKSGRIISDMGDRKILEDCHRGNKLLVTCDADFLDLITIHKQPHAGVIILRAILTAEQQVKNIVDIINENADLLNRKYVIILDKDKNIQLVSPQQQNDPEIRGKIPSKSRRRLALVYG